MSRLCHVSIVGCFFLSLLGPPSEAQGLGEPATLQSESASMPVKEVTAFKDGHAFVVRQGAMPVTEGGDVVLDDLPTPIQGTFWASCSLGSMHLGSVVAGRRRVLVERTALSLRELVEANSGARVIVTEKDDVRYHAEVLGFPERTAAERARTEPKGDDLLPEKSDILLLKTDQGTRLVPFGRIVDVVFKDAPKMMAKSEEFRNLLTLRLDWEEEPRQSKVPVTMGYVERGFRWIPSYRILIDGKGSAEIELQATLVNDLADLSDTTVNLVVGVPRFLFQDEIDPIALKEAIARIHSYRRSDMGISVSNAIQTQVAMNPQSNLVSGAGSEETPSDLPGSRSEDLYIFTVRGVTLAKGSRMVVPVTRAKIPYSDIYTLDLPFAPPPEVNASLNSTQHAELARLIKASVMHKVRLVNTTNHPFTTAPVLILKDGKVLGQGLMTYTPGGSNKELEITTAVNVKVQRADRETERTSGAERWNGQSYGRVNLEGNIELTNFGTEKIKIRVTRGVLGIVDGADHHGDKVQVNLHEADARDGLPSAQAWWHWYRWPSWWFRFNGLGRISWELDIDPKQKVELAYQWHYFWQ